MLIAWMFALQNSTVHELCALLIFVLASGLLEIESNARIYVMLYLWGAILGDESEGKGKWAPVSWRSTVVTLSLKTAKDATGCLAGAPAMPCRLSPGRVYRDSISEGNSEEKERVFMRTCPVCPGQRSRHQVLIPMYF